MLDRYHERCRLLAELRNILRLIQRVFQRTVIMSKRNSLAAAVVLSITGAMNLASAVELNPNGLGQVLLYPYFTVNANNQTLISVVNTRDTGKVAKVRFLEGYDGREVLGFNVYLSPHDVWVAAIFDTSGLSEQPNDGSAPAGLLTPDNSCTDPGIKVPTSVSLPQLPDGRYYVPFSNSAYSGLSLGATGPEQNDGGPTDLKRTRTGHIELIEMASVIGDSLANITHENGVPVNCAALTGAQNNADYTSPTGGLFGAASIVNASIGTLYGYNADALSGFYTNTGKLFSPSGTTFPNLTSGDNGNISTGNEVSYVFGNDGSLITSSWPLNAGGSVDAVSSLFTADQIFNEYEIDLRNGSVATEWILTFPTKSYYANPALGSAIQPFTKLFGSDSAHPGTACEVVSLKKYDREGKTPHSSGSIGVPPPPPPQPTLCWEAQTTVVLSAASVGLTSPIFGSPLLAIIDPTDPGTSGMVGVVLSGNGHLLRPSNEGNVFAGLPITGFLARNFTNKNATPGVLGNYAGLFRHHISQACSNPSGACH